MTCLSLVAWYQATTDPPGPSTNYKWLLVYEIRADFKPNSTKGQGAPCYQRRICVENLDDISQISCAGKTKNETNSNKIIHHSEVVSNWNTTQTTHSQLLSTHALT